VEWDDGVAKARVFGGGGAECGGGH
jgi:hypothetical protein